MAKEDNDLFEKYANAIIKGIANSNRTSFCTILFAVFVTLKLTGVISWSWWWVTAPLWGGIILALVFIVLLLLILYLVFLLKDK